MVNKETVLFIAEGGLSIGFGHISRSITIAEEFKEQGYDVLFLQKEGGYFRNEIEERFKVFTVKNFSEEHHASFNEVITENRIGTVVLDLVESEYLKLSWLRERFKNLKIVTITLFLFDYKKRYEHLSFFPDMEFTSDRKINSGNYGFHLFAGPEYIVFRKEFRNLDKQVRKDANKVLITMGGTDPQGISLKVIKALQEFDGLKITLIISKLSPHYKTVQSVVESESATQINLIEKSNNIADLMLEHDIIILNGGLTRYEACLTKTPFIAIAIHKKQFEITRKLTKLGTGINLGLFQQLKEMEIKESVDNLLKNYNLRKQISERMSKIFDGYGANRIFKRIIEYRIEK